MHIKAGLISAILAASCVAPSVWADELVASAASPNKVLNVDVRIESGGRLSYAIKRRGEDVITWSRLGFVLTNAPKFDGGFSLDKKTLTSHDDTWEQPWGERQFVRNNYQELRLDLVQKDFKNRRIACSGSTTMVSGSATSSRSRSS